MLKNNRIEICGNIAAGKTTLTKALASCGLISVNEKFDRNPFIESFYIDPARFSFETEIIFLLQHYHSIKIAKEIKHLVCDYSLTLDKAYADVTLPDSRREIFLKIVEELEQEIGVPDKIIYLNCPEEILLERIAHRNRSFETGIQIGYLQALSAAIEIRMKEAAEKSEVLKINSHELNFVLGVEGIADLEAFCVV